MARRREIRRYGVVVNNKLTETDKWPGPKKSRQDIQDNPVNPVKKNKKQTGYTG
jgi:hypothetical protein